MSYGYRQPCLDTSRIAQGPATLAVAAIASTVIGAGVAAYGQIQASDARAQAANYQAEVAARNAKVSAANALYAEQAGAAQEEQTALKTRALVGQAVAAQASSGVDVNSGSPLEVRASIAALGQLSGLTIRNSAARQAYGYRVQGADYDAAAGFAEKSAADATAAGEIGAATSIIGGITGAGNMAIKDYQAGIFPMKLAG